MATGGYTPAEIREMSALEMMLIRHYQEKEQSDFLDRLGTYLGVLWDLDVLKADAASKGAATRPNRIFTPLTMVINPQILDLVKGQKSVSVDYKQPFIGGGEYIPRAGQKIASVGELSREDFYTLLGRKAPKMRQSPSPSFGAPGAIPEKSESPMAFAQNKPSTFSRDKSKEKSTPPRKPRR
jgi:hypothetical protein